MCMTFTTVIARWLWHLPMLVRPVWARLQMYVIYFVWVCVTDMLPMIVYPPLWRYVVDMSVRDLAAPATTDYRLVWCFSDEYTSVPRMFSAYSRWYVPHRSSGRCIMLSLRHHMCALWRYYQSCSELDCVTMFTVSSTLVWAVLTGKTGWVCHIGTLTLCIEVVVEWFWWDSSLISTTNWFPSVLWHCWFGHLLIDSN